MVFTAKRDRIFRISGQKLQGRVGEKDDHTNLPSCSPTQNLTKFNKRATKTRKIRSENGNNYRNGEKIKNTKLGPKTARDEQTKKTFVFSESANTFRKVFQISRFSHQV
jgi:hypothetical protein